MKPDLPYSVPRPSGMSQAQFVTHLYQEAHKQRRNGEFLRSIMEETLAEAGRIEALAVKLERDIPPAPVAEDPADERFAVRWQEPGAV